MRMRSLRTKLVLFWIVFAALLVAAVDVIGFSTARDIQLQHLRQTLMTMAATGALSIDGDAHAQIPPTALSMELPVYRALVDRLRAIRGTNPNIRYVYTMVPSRTAGRWYYVGDAEEMPRRFSRPGALYDASRYPAMLQGLTGPSADEALTTDEWGVLLSGYAPIRTRDGRVVAVLGVDMSGEHVVRLQNVVRRAGLWVLAMALFVVVGLGIQIARWISRPIQHLVIGTRRIGEGDLTYRVPVESADEVGILAQSFNQMAERLSVSLAQLREHVLSTLQALLHALEAKDRFTRGHSARVQHYAVKIAKQIGLSPAEVEIVDEMSVLHDVGKIGIKESVLGKAGQLTVEEFEEIKRHPELGHRILSPLKLSKEALDIVLHHHERVNGLGYPAGLKAEEIPVMVGIVSVADAFDAMTGYRPYRPVPMTIPEAVAELTRCSGTQFMPSVVGAMVQVLKQEGDLPGDGGGAV